MAEELKNCPLCGGEAELEDHRLVWSVNCKSCDVSFYGDRAEEPEHDNHTNEYWKHYIDSAIKSWNTRQIEAQLKKDNEQLRALVKRALKTIGVDHCVIHRITEYNEIKAELDKIGGET